MGRRGHVRTGKTRKQQRRRPQRRPSRSAHHTGTPAACPVQPTPLPEFRTSIPSSSSTLRLSVRKDHQERKRAGERTRQRPCPQPRRHVSQVNLAHSRSDDGTATPPPCVSPRSITGCEQPSCETRPRIAIFTTVAPNRWGQPSVHSSTERDMHHISRSLVTVFIVRAIFRHELRPLTLQAATVPSGVNRHARRSSVHNRAFRTK